MFIGRFQVETKKYNSHGLDGRHQNGKLREPSVGAVNGPDLVVGVPVAGASCLAERPRTAVPQT